MFRKLLLLCLASAVLALGLWGCTDVPKEYTININGKNENENTNANTNTNTEGVAANPCTVFGKVIDRQSRQGIGNATVYIKVAGTWYSTATTASSVIGDAGGTGDSTAGDFKLSGLPYNTQMPIIIKGPSGMNYFQFTTRITTPTAPNAGVNSARDLDLGQYALDKGVTATIYLVDANIGSYITKTGNAPIAVYYGFGGSAGGSVEDIVATQDATYPYKYTITIPQSSDTILSVPAIDDDGDGKYDYQSATTTITALTASQGNVTTNIALSPVTNATALSVVTDNIMTAGANGGGTQLTVIGKNDPVKIFFNMPVSIVTSGTGTYARLTYSDDYKVLTSAPITSEVLLQASVSSDGTVLVLQPATSLIENKTYTMAVDSISLASSATAAADTVYALNSIFTPPSLFIYSTAAGTLGNSPVVTVDNFNHRSSGILHANATIATADTGPFIVFKEPVWGTVSLVKVVTSNSNTSYYDAPAALTGQATQCTRPGYNNATNCVDWWIHSVETNTQNNHGANFSDVTYPTGTSLYRFNLGTAFGIVTMADFGGGFSSQITLEVDVYNALGVPYRSIETFNID